MKVSIKQISEITGYSQATVSNALNNKRGVSRETASIILQAARDHGLFFETRISKIRFVMYSAGAQIVMDTPFFSSLIQGIENECRENGYELIISRIDKMGGSEDYDGVLQQVLYDTSSAILLLATEMSREDLLPFKTAVVPVTVLDNWFAGLDLNSVLINNTDSVCDAVEWLAAKGHKKIGYLKSSVRINNFAFRELGYRKALANRSCDYNPAHTFTLTPTMNGAHEDMLHALSEPRDVPTAVFADNDIIALGAMKALKEKGYRIPHDISIIGFDDLPFCGISSPPLTTIRVLKQEMGRVAVRRLIEIMKNGDTFATKTQICNEFIIRDSVCNLSEDTPRGNQYSAQSHQSI